MAPSSNLKIKNSVSFLKITSWLLAGGVMLLSILVWARERFDGLPLSTYDYFPILGLGAFSLMWTHYVLGSLRRYLGASKNDNKLYFNVTSVAILAMILLHPGLLIAQLNRDGFGSPPQSYSAVYPDSMAMISLGSIALIIFLIFELKRKFGEKKWWRIIEWLQVVAMAMIFFHGLSLGRELSVNWYRAIWFLLGLSFVAAIIYNTRYDNRINNGGKDGTAK